MKFISQSIEGLVLIRPEVFEDNRGAFLKIPEAKGGCANSQPKWDAVVKVCAPRGRVPRDSKAVGGQSRHACDLYGEVEMRKRSLVGPGCAARICEWTVCSVNRAVRAARASGDKYGCPNGSSGGMSRLGTPVAP